MTPERLAEIKERSRYSNGLSEQEAKELFGEIDRLKKEILCGGSALVLRLDSLRMTPLLAAIEVDSTGVTILRRVSLV